ncbi:tetratricopeptide repeat protein [Nonomuraea mesophila]|uniref:Tetratricopeptide repeat protein n=1 Tax=Nonomuraea mesophila TaxID=2530382 RepID=A0A4R5EFP4_9ACTN|nr:tetratricopeptide repeat protein [Nonomuraea mesophila]TDE33140.1 tetratricopeptide repeat protein [Nonomuraea mesophila]
MGKQGKLWLISIAALLVALIAWGSLAGWWPFLSDKNNVLWAEPVSWLAGIAGSVAGVLSLFVSVYALRIDKKDPTGQTSTGREQQRVEQPLATGVPPPQALSRSPLIDRKDERVVLLARLTEGPWGVVIVTGQRGVGKTRLVDQVVAELESASVGPRPRIFRHEAVPGLGIDTRALIADIETLQGDDAVRWSEVSDAPPADHVRASLEEIGGTWAVIVIERAENLLDSATHQLDDPELGEVFEVLTAVDGHRIAVVLVTRDLPRSAARGRWATRAPIEVGRLERTFFLTFIGDRITNHKTTMLKAAHRHYDLFQGNLRLAELACVISQSPGHSPAWLSKRLKGMTAGDVPKFLIESLVAGLDPGERSVLEVLDAYGTSVDAEAVRALLTEAEHGTKPPLDDVGAILTGLVDKRVADKTRDGEYCLALSEEERTWAGLPGEDGPIGEKEKKLLIHAAEELAQRRVSPPRTAEDLRLHLAGMRAFIRAGSPQSAYNRMRVIDRELRKRHCAFLLREPRERLRGKLAKFNPARELDNDNALGEIYASSGDFDRASKAYGRALQQANDQQNLTRRMRVRANFAAAYWWIRDAQNACNQHKWTLDDHNKLALSNPEECLALLPVRMGALAGLADCQRHWGKYDEAIQYAEEALAVPRTTGYPDTADDRVLVLSRSVSINLKLAHWYAELGEPEAAEAALTATEESLAGHDEDWLHSRYRVGIAEVWLGHDDEEAMQAAQKAVELARKYNDPIILLRARTILCQIHLARHDLVNATRQIESAAQYRYVGRPLLTPALRALVSLAGAGQSGDDGGKAAALLRDLLDETSRRIDRDEDDVTAWDFKGFALCGLRLNSQASLVEAIDAFRMARAKTSRATPGLVDRLLFLLERLDDCGRTPERLQRVCDVLSAARARPHGA